MSDPTDADRPDKIWPAAVGFFAADASAPAPGGDHFRQVLDALPAAVYITDNDGLITYYNEAAARLWGWRPQFGQGHWCGSWKLFQA